MSDILIKGMEMPESCWACRFNVDAWCTATIQKNKYNDDVYDYARDKTKPDWCPLVEVPEPHGRLIDADALLQEHERIVDSWGLAHIVSAQAVRNAPTVIEAEEGE